MYISNAVDVQRGEMFPSRLCSVTSLLTGVNKIGKKLIASAFSDDGIIECIESKELSYCIGIQWHPEFLIDKKDISIFKSLIYCAKNKIEK